MNSIKEKKGTLGDAVLIELGVNSPFTETTGEELIKSIGSKTPILWLTLHSNLSNVTWKSQNLSIMEKLAKKYKNIKIVDWDKEASKHSDWFYQDGTHLKPNGQIGFAKYIKSILIEQFGGKATSESTDSSKKQSESSSNTSRESSGTDADSDATTTDD